MNDTRVSLITTTWAAENVVDWVLQIIYYESDELHLAHIIPVPMPEVITAGFGAMDSTVTVNSDPKEDLKHIADAKEMMKWRVVTLASKDATGADYPPFDRHTVHWRGNMQAC